MLYILIGLLISVVGVLFAIGAQLWYLNNTLLLLLFYLEDYLTRDISFPHQKFSRGEDN